MTYTGGICGNVAREDGIGSRLARAGKRARYDAVTSGAAVEVELQPARIIIISDQCTTSIRLAGISHMSPTAAVIESGLKARDPFMPTSIEMVAAKEVAARARAENRDECIVKIRYRNTVGGEDLQGENN